ncbi:DUF4381 domain-containing protein [Rosistilla oblonga]|uniref:DUF4381 domain-containing protein n=1 Tax=Rosistilla oblonga TaxID=2527990 RepID=UPI003A974A9A
MDDATSLDRLHDIVVPPEVPWWPPAPGWYAVMILVAAGVLAIAYRAWRHWQANRYRRAALQELQSADSAAAISEILRRTALAIQPRGEIADLVGDRWAAWLSEAAPQPMPPQVREQLASAIYRKSETTGELNSLREYASGWIQTHEILAATNPLPEDRHGC